MKKFLSLMLALVLIVGIVAGCGTKMPASTTTGGDAATPDANGGDAATPDVAGPLNIRVCIASEPQTIDPQLNTSVDGAVMAHHTFEGLFKWADDGDGDAILVPGQIEDDFTETENADGSITYTFTIRGDAKWSDGQAVVAGDFEYGLKRLCDPATAADYSYLVDGIIVGATEVLGGEADPDTLAVKALDDSTLEITIATICPYFTELLAFPALFPVRQDIIETHGDQWTFEPATYISNGPYKMAEWVHNGYINYVKNDQYYDYANLGPESIRFDLMDDANAMLTAFRNGELDFIENMPIDEIPALIDSGDLHIVPYIGTYYVSFQVQKAPFDDPRVREALTLAIDRTYITESVTRAGQVPADGFVPSGINDADVMGPDFRANGGGWFSIDPADYEANCERARQLLAEAGFPGGAGFPTVEYLYNTNADHAAVAQAIQADWARELGVNVTLNNQDWNVFLQTRKDGDYQIARNGWIADFNDPISFLDMWVTGGGNNDAQYANPDYDALIFAAKTESDPAVRMDIQHQAEKIIADEFLLSPIYFYTNKYMLNPAIEGMFYTPLGYFMFNYTYTK